MNENKSSVMNFTKPEGGPRKLGLSSLFQLGQPGKYIDKPTFGPITHIYNIWKQITSSVVLCWHYHCHNVRIGSDARNHLPRCSNYFGFKLNSDFFYILKIVNFNVINNNKRVMLLKHMLTKTNFLG